MDNRGLQKSLANRYKKSNDNPKLQQEITFILLTRGNCNLMTDAAIMSHKKLEYPSTGGRVTCQNSPFPFASCRA